MTEQKQGRNLDGPLTILGSETELDSVLIQYLVLCTICTIAIIIIIVIVIIIIIIIITIIIIIMIIIIIISLFTVGRDIVNMHK